MKTAELTGAELDYWVAKAEVKPPYGIERYEKWLAEDWQSGSDHYSTSWVQGGPIVESLLEQGFGLHAGKNDSDYGDAFTCSNFDSECMPWDGKSMDAPMVLQYGSTPLIAAMRAYVASKFGKEVKGPAC